LFLIKNDDGLAFSGKKKKRKSYGLPQVEAGKRHI
jgi:hypothetical protein